MEKNTILFHNKFGNGSMFNVWDTVLPEEDCIAYVQSEVENPQSVAISGSVINARGEEVIHIQKN